MYKNIYIVVITLAFLFSLGYCQRQVNLTHTVENPKIIKLKDSTELVIIQNQEVSLKELKKRVKELSTKESTKYIHDVHTVVTNSTTIEIDTFIQTDTINYFPFSFQDSNRYYNIKGIIYETGISINLNVSDTVSVFISRKNTIVRHSNKFITNNSASVYQTKPKKQWFAKIIAVIASGYLGYKLAH